MEDAERPPCPGCGERLERLGGIRMPGTEGATIDHFRCPACGRAWIHRSGRGWAETTIDLSAG